jgi:membrane protease YdiL (CAAX protease family)
VPIWIDHVLFIVLALLFPIRASTFGYRRLLLAGPEELPRVRLSVYRQAVVIQWGLSALVVAVWIVQRRLWAALGLKPVLSWGLLGVALGLAVIVLVLLRQHRAALASDEALAEVRSRMSHLEPMFPASPEELRWFYRLSMTAGVCEELLYRGYMIWYLSHWTGLFQAAGIASLIFGVGHAYQGWRGVLGTTLLGAFLAGVFILTGSLYAAMLAHALMDIHSGHLSYVAFRRGREQRDTGPGQPDPALTADRAPSADPW